MICTTIKSCAQEVFKWISNQHEVGEESITDWTLYKANDLDYNISYKLFNRQEEGRTSGADFELLIITNRYHFKARVQAKRLRPGHDHYNAIAYSNDHGLQIDKLRDDARLHGLRPLYAFYNNEKAPSRCARGITDEGIYIACADELYNDVILHPGRTIDTNYLISKSTPFSCWFCCPLCDRLGERSLKDFSEEYHPAKDQQTPSGITEELPPYAQLFMQFEKAGGDNIKMKEVWETEFAEYFKGVDALFVVDRRTKE